MRQCSRGFTLIEVLAACVLVGAVLLPLLGAMRSSVRTAAWCVRLHHAVPLALQVHEEVVFDGKAPDEPVWETDTGLQGEVSCESVELGDIGTFIHVTVSIRDPDASEDERPLVLLETLMPSEGGTGAR